MISRTFLLSAILLCRSAIAQTNPCDSLDASFTFAANGTLVVFQANTFHNDWSYSWDLGDGTSGIGPVHTHIYPGPTLFQACLTVWAWDPVAQDTCFASSCQLVNLIGGSPCGQLQAGFFPYASPAGVQFSNTTTGTGISSTWSWDFGDGSSSADAQPYHTYAQPGTYTVCLTAISIYQQPGGIITCMDTLCAPVVVPGADPCDSLQACFVPSSWGPQSLFFNNCTSTPDFPGTQFVWDFGDGSSSATPAPVHTFPPGVWTVCLTASWQSCADTLCQTVTIPGGAGCDSTFSAAFTWVDQGGGIVVFQGSSSLPANGYLWDFGDGSTGFGMNTQHPYQQPGQYQVCLDAWYWNGSDTCWTQTCQWVVAGGNTNPCDSLDASFTFAANGTLVVFQANTFHNDWSYSWDLGDGTSGIGPVHTHIYPGPTLFQACLTVWTWDPVAQDTCFASSCQLVNLIGGSPCGQLQAGFFPYSSPAGVQFSNTTTGTGISSTWSWDFGDGSSSADAQPYHTYAQPGTYTVCLTAISIYQQPGGIITCMDTLCAPVVVPGADPCAGVVASNFTWTSLGGLISFVNLTSSTGQAQYWWDFGDGDGSPDPDPVHLYADSVPHWACLTSWTWVGNTLCADTLCQWVTPGQNGPVGVDGSTIPAKCRLWPVPAGDVVWLDGTGPAAGSQWRMRDLSGRVMGTGMLAGGPPFQVEVSSLRPGIYLLELHLPTGALLVKLVRE